MSKEVTVFEAALLDLAAKACGLSLLGALTMAANKQLALDAGLNAGRSTS